jgi:uncharacterized protein
VFVGAAPPGTPARARAPRRPLIRRRAPPAISLTIRHPSPYIDSLFAGEMKLSLSQVPAGGCAIAFTADPQLLGDAGEGVRVTGPIQVSGRADLEAAGLRVRGTIETGLTLTCSRCLEPFDFPVRSRFDATYTSVVPTEDEVELDARDLTVCHLEGDTVDLGELVHEQVLLAVPMAPVCDAGCKGLCPTCGANLNREACGCEAPAADPRFAVLRKLKSV